MYPKLNKEMQFRLNEINGIKECYHCNIRNQTMNKTLNKYIATFHYVSKTFTRNKW